MIEKATPNVSRALKSLLSSGRYPRSASRELSRMEPAPSLPMYTSFLDIEGSTMARDEDGYDVDSAKVLDSWSLIVPVMTRFATISDVLPRSNAN